MTTSTPTTDAVTIYRICPRCNGSGQVPDGDSKWGSASDACRVPCPDCKLVRVVELGKFGMTYYGMEIQLDLGWEMCTPCL